MVTIARFGLLVKSTSMETRELRVVGGNLALDFANTVDDPTGPAHHDHLGTYPELVTWSIRAGLRPPAEPHPLRQAHALRSAIQSIFTTIAAGDPVTEGQWTALRPFATDAMAHAVLAPGGHALTWPSGVLWPVAHAAVELLTSPNVKRVKKCGGCPWLFVDSSKNGSRRWCSMEDCGTHEKIQRYVARRRTRRNES
jgi:predicted RNA-binding Zn ribbon-like protein